MVLKSSHHGASNANRAKINTVTPTFLNFIQFYMKIVAIIESLKSSLEQIVIAKNRNFLAVINPVQRISFNITRSFLLVYTTQF